MRGIGTRSRSASSRTIAYTRGASCSLTGLARLAATAILSLNQYEPPTRTRAMTSPIMSPTWPKIAPMPMMRPPKAANRTTVFTVFRIPITPETSLSPPRTLGIPTRWRLTMNDRRCEGSERDAGVRDRYRPAEFDAERYSGENLSYWTPIMVRLGRIGQDDYVLDLGCATGGLSCAIAEATGAQLVGCDISSTLLEYARRNRGGPSTQWVRADAARLPFTHLS